MPRIIEDDTDSDATAIIMEKETPDAGEGGYDSDTESFVTPSPMRVRTRRECKMVVTPCSEQRLKMRNKIANQLHSDTETESEAQVSEGGSSYDEEGSEYEEESSEYESDTESDSSAPVAKHYNLPHPRDLQKPKVIDKILAHKQFATDPPEEDNLHVIKYLIKYKYRSHHHLEWLLELDIENLWTGTGRHMKLTNYQSVNDIRQPFRSGRGTSSGAVYFDDGFLKPERIAAKEVYQNETYFLIKWAYLNYNDCTWETEAFVVDELKQVRLVSLFNSWSVTTPGKLSIGNYRPEMQSLPEILTKVRGFHFMGNKSLRDYQQAGVSWMVQNWQARRSCILGDEMGLGKTCQMITFFESLRRLYGLDGPFLVIAPLATLGHWQREATEWTDFNVVCYGGNGDSRNIIENFEFYHRNRNGEQTKNIKFNIVVTTYEWIIRSPATFNNNKWASIVIDEGHRLKNENSSLFLRLEKFKSDFRVILTGTPVQNNIGELYAILRFLDHRIVPKTRDKFIANFTPLTQERLGTLFELLGDRLLRREKDLVEKSIPPKIEIMVKVPMVKFQAQAYRASLIQNADFLAGDRGRQAASKSRNISMDLRKCCNHPWLLDGGEAKTLEDAGLTFGGQPSDSNEVMELLLRSSAKMIFLDKLLAKLRKEGHRVLIFSQFVMMLEVIQDYLYWRKYPFEYLSGNVASDERQRSVDRFQDPNHDAFVFLISTRAGGCGINLTAASKVVIFDSDWNPQNDLQAQARCHRIGQTKQVDVYRVLAENTYEDRMFEIASQKLGLDHVILNAQQQVQDHGMSKMKISDEDIEKALRHGAYSLYNDKQESDTKIEENIDELLERAKKIVHVSGDQNGDSGPKTVSAVRGLAAFSTVKFNEINEDPDFWKKVLPEKMDALALMRRINGDDPPETADQVTDFMELLRKVVSTEILTASEDTKFYMAESLNRQKQVVSLLVRVQSLPQFADHAEELKEKISKVSAPRQFRKKRTKNQEPEEVETPKKENVAKQMDPLRRWKTASITSLIHATKKFGYGRWNDLITFLRNQGVYPEVDYLTPTMRHCVSAALIESIADYITEVAADLPRIGAKKPNKKKSKSKKKQADSSDSSSDNESESESNSEDEAAKVFGTLEAKVTPATVQKIRSLQRSITSHWKSAALTDLQNTNSKPIVIDNGISCYPVTVQYGLREEDRSDELVFHEFPKIEDDEDEDLPRCGTAIKINVSNPHDVNMDSNSEDKNENQSKSDDNNKEDEDNDIESKKEPTETWSCMIIIAKKDKAKDLRRVHCLTSISGTSVEVRTVMPGDSNEYIVYAVALEAMTSEEQLLLSGDDKYSTPLQQNMLSAVLQTPTQFVTIRGKSRIEASGITSQKLSDLAMQLGNEAPEQLTYWQSFGKLFNPLTISSDGDEERLPSGVVIPSEFKNLNRIEGLDKNSTPFEIFSASKSVFRNAMGRNGYQLKAKLPAQLLTEIAKSSLAEQGCYRMALLPDDQVVKISKQLSEEKFINEDGTFDVVSLSAAASVKASASAIQPTMSMITPGDISDEDSREIVEKALNAIDRRVRYAKLLREVIEAAEKESKTNPESSPSMRNICMTIERNLPGKKPPSHWSAKCEFQHLKGILKYGFNPAYIAWDPDLGFSEKANEKKKKGSDRTFVALFPGYKTYFTNLYSVLYKVLSGEIKITVRVKANQPKAKKAKTKAADSISSDSSSSETDQEDSKRVKPKAKPKVTPKATPKAKPGSKKSTSGKKNPLHQDSFDDLSLKEFIENFSSITSTVNDKSQKAVTEFFEKKTTKSAKKAPTKKSKRSSSAVSPPVKQRKTLTLDSDEESESQKADKKQKPEVVSISDSESLTQRDEVPPANGSIQREETSLSGTPTEQDAQESMDPIADQNGKEKPTTNGSSETDKQNGTNNPTHESVDSVTAKSVSAKKEPANPTAGTNGSSVSAKAETANQNGITNPTAETNGSNSPSVEALEN